MKKLKFYIYTAIVMIATSSYYATMCDKYNPEEYSSKTPVDFVYVNKSDYKINALLLDHETSAYDTLLNNKTTINLEPGENVTFVTDNIIDGSKSIFEEYIVVFNDSVFFSYYAKPRVSPYHANGWNADIPLYPTSYKIHSGVNEQDHTIYEFTFTNEHYESVCDRASIHEKISKNENGERYFTNWGYYKDPQNRGTGVLIDSLLWSPFDYDTKAEQLQGHFHYFGYEESLTVCPKGWRVPEAEEFSSLIANHSSWGDNRSKLDTNSELDSNTEDGYWFSGSKNYSLDVPAVHFSPHYLWKDNELKVGMYWTSTRDSEGMAFAFRFDSSGDIGLVRKDESETYLLRCVKNYDRRKYYFGD